MFEKTPFPPQMGWAVAQDIEFGVYTSQPRPGDPELTLLVSVGGDGKFEGDFRVQLSGETPIRAQIPAGGLLPVAEAAKYRLTIETRPEEIEFRRNGVTSGWIDADQR